MCALWTCWWCLCKSTILKQMFPSLTGFRCPLICMVVLVLCQEPLREAVSPYRGSQRRNKRSWLETSVWVNYLPQFLEQLSVMLGYFSKAHFECIKSNNWHAGQQMTVLKIICHLGSLFQCWFCSVHRTVCSPFLTTAMLMLASVESCFYDFICTGRSLLGYFTGQCVLCCAKEEIIWGFSCTYLYFHKS